MTNYQLSAPARQCAASGRELKPGERFFGALIDEGGKFVRKDFAPEAWSGPPEGAVGHWMGKVPRADEQRKPPVNDELLAECLTHLAATKEPGRLHFRYVVALLLMRRKRLRFEDVRRDGADEYLILRDAKGSGRYEVLDPRLTDEQMAAVQDEVFRVLGWQ